MALRGVTGGEGGGDTVLNADPLPVRLHEGRKRERGGEREARRDQRMTGEPEEERQPKQRLTLRFPRAGFHAG